MRQFITTAGFLAWLAVAICPAAAQPAVRSPRETLVVSPAWVAAHLHDPDLVLLHVGNRATYDAGHLPGARYVDFRTTVTEPAAGGLTLEMPAAPALRERLADLGISDGSRVVVYQSDELWTPSTRVMLTLDYAGLRNAAWLDGGQKAWTKTGHELTTAIPEHKRGTLSALRLRPVVVDAAFVKAHLNTSGFAIVDARDPAFYDGTRTGGRAPAEHKTGHIPGAVNVPFDQFTSSDVELKAAVDVAAAFTRVGVKAGDTIIGYCHIGQQATAMLFAARTLGYKVLLYDGSFEDWSRQDLPVENPSASKVR